MDNVIVGVEDTEEARDALRFAREFARLERAELHVVSVDPTVVYYEGEQEANEARELYFWRSREIARSTLGEDFQFHRKAEMSPPAGLIAAAEELSAVAIVIGSSHRGPMGRVLMGDTGARLSAGAPSPVAVVPRGWTLKDEKGIAFVGVGYDGSEESDAALSFAAALPGKLEASVTLIGVVPRILRTMSESSLGGDPQELLNDEMKRRLQDASSQIKSGDVGILVREGFAADRLVQASKNLDLLVLGSRGYGPVRRVFLGGTSIRVMRGSACPVVIVPKEHED